MDVTDDADDRARRMWVSDVYVLAERILPAKFAGGGSFTSITSGILGVRLAKSRPRSSETPIASSSRRNHVALAMVQAGLAFICRRHAGRGVKVSTEGIWLESRGQNAGMDLTFHFARAMYSRHGSSFVYRGPTAKRERSTWQVEASAH